MDRVALGEYVAQEFDGPMRRCLATELVIFSGLKADKLDDLEAMIARGTIRWVFTAGSLAMALKKAEAEGRGATSRWAWPKIRPMPTSRISFPTSASSRPRMLAGGKGQGNRVRAPDRFRAGRWERVVDDRPGRAAIRHRSRHQRAIRAKVGAVHRRVRNQPAVRAGRAFHNGVFGMFEDPVSNRERRRFIEQLKRMKEAGVEVYIGGGEGGGTGTVR